MNNPSIRKLIPVAVSLTLATSAGSCSDDFERPGQPDAPRETVCLRAEISQTAATRADESGFADGDRMGVFAVTHKSDIPGTLATAGNHADNVAFTLNADDGTWKAASDIYWVDKQTPVDFYAYYPFVNVVTSTESYPFEVESDQSRQSRDGELSAYEASDFLSAMAANAQPGKRVDLTFRHRLAGVKVVLEPGSGFSDSEWGKLPRIVTVDNTLREAEINLSSGKATAVGEYDRNTIMNPQGEESSVYRAVVVPQDVAAGKSTIGITIDGVSYLYNNGSVKFKLKSSRESLDSCQFTQGLIPVSQFS